jgi:amino acid adenylation domain-containing protein
VVETSQFTLRDIVSYGASTWPSQPALVDGDVVTTFAELSRRVAIAARRLRAHSVQPRDRVAILGRRSTPTVIALFAAATLGATYVALDPEQPLARIEGLLLDADVRVVLAEDDLAGALQEHSGGVPVLPFSSLAEECTRSTRETSKNDPRETSKNDPRETSKNDPRETSKNDPRETSKNDPREVAAPAAFVVEPTDTAYILYTSGSTGRPKGVPIEHASIRTFFEAHNERVGIRPGDRCLSTGPFYFDVSILDVLLPLYFGATVYFAPKTLVPSLVLTILERHAITHLYAVGTILGLITGDGRRLDRFHLGALRVLQTGAEVCNVRVVNEWLRRYPRLSFLNSYGPTEATVGCLSYLKPYEGPLREATCPIGKPHRGTDVRLVDESGAIIETPFTVGELIVAGPQVMRRYFRRPEETQRAFLSIAGQTYYRTGDHAHVDGEGNYHFVGRIDDEVKLHGCRIHLNEIKQVLEADPLVEQAVLGLITPAGEQELAALVVPRNGTPRELLTSIASRARGRLASYMVPSRWAALRAVPRLPSGKTDRSTLLSTLTQAAGASRATFFEGDAMALLPLP